MQSKPSVSDTGERDKGIAPKPKSVSATRLDSVQQAIEQQGFSANVASHISRKSVRSSTSRIYDQKWDTFVIWCKDLQLDPFTCSIPRVADFLFSRRDRGLLPATIEGYRSAISSTWSKMGNHSLSDNAAISALLRSFRTERPVVDRTIPSWDLALVLDALSRPPFEPLGEVTMANLTVKTVFLVALATAKRRSEIHAIVMEGSGLSSCKSNFVLAFDRNFVSKTRQTTKLSERHVVLPALHEEGDDVQLLCPVRAIVVYLERTKQVRSQHNPKKLFISYKSGFEGHDVSTQSISRWIQQAIKWSYLAAASHGEMLKVHKIKAHDVRAFATSVAFERNVSLADIMAAACWRCHTTFTSYYLRDLSLQSNDLYKLGPIVAAQQVIH